VKGDLNMDNKEEIIKKNKELVEKYPFILPRNYFTDEVPEDYDYSWTDWDAIPDGWRIAFGDMLLEDIYNDAVEHDYLDSLRFDQIKEKFGELRIYARGYRGGRLDEIISNYSLLSGYICINCGKPDVYSTTGWITPICKECWEHGSEQPYEEAVYKYGDEEYRLMPNVRKYTRRVDGEFKTFEVYISDLANRIRERWNSNGK
jgi:hypothetical protein